MPVLTLAAPQLWLPPDEIRTPDGGLWNVPADRRFRPRVLRMPGYPCCCGAACDNCLSMPPDTYAVTFADVVNGTCGDANHCADYWNDTFTLVHNEDEPVNACAWIYPGPESTDYDSEGDCSDGCGTHLNQVQLFWYTLAGNYGIWVIASIATVHCAGESVEFYKEWGTKQSCHVTNQELDYDPLADAMATCDFSAATCHVS